MDVDVDVDVDVDLDVDENVRGSAYGIRRRTDYGRSRGDYH